MMSKLITRLALAGVLTLGPMVAAAQVTPPAGGQRQRLELERRLNQGFQRSIQNQLGFDQAKMQGIQGVMRSFQTDRRSLNRSQASLRHRLRDPALTELSEPDARSLLQEMVTLQQRELELYQREQEELLKLMTPVELLRFYRLRENLGERIQQVRQGRGQGGARGGGVGGGIGGTVRPGGGPNGGRIFR